MLAYAPSSYKGIRDTHFFMACLVLKACSFCVAGDMISSEGETYCCGLYHVSLLRKAKFEALLLLIIHARLQNLTVVLEALGLVLLGRGRWLDLGVGVADAEHIGRHFGLLLAAI
jgi:hypothetical protein